MTSIILETLKALEWKSRRQGPGTSMGAQNGDWYKSCPMCGGLEKRNGDFIASAVGHRPDCKLEAAIKEAERS